MQRILIAVSGGVDSVVLLDRMVRAKSEIGVAHVHHGLREASDEEYTFVQQLAADYGVPFHGTRLSFPGGGSQASYRQARYAFFQHVMEQEGYDELMTAHHADDQVETVLLQLWRNVVEVKGMLPRRPFGNGTLTRPLLNERKADLLAYATRHGLVWRDDSTNDTQVYTRNWIRHEIVPRLLQENPNLHRDVLYAAAHAAELWRTRYKVATRWMETHMHLGMKAFHVKLDEVSRLSSEEWYAVTRLIAKRYGVEIREGVNRLLSSQQPSGRYDVKAPFVLEKRDGTLYLTQRFDVPQNEPVVISDVPTVCVFGKRTVTLEVVEGEIGIPLERLTFPLMVRSVRPGDRIELKIGHKKVSRVLIDAKVNRADRAHVPILVDATGRIIAIVGIRVSDFLDVSDATCPRLMVK